MAVCKLSKSADVPVTMAGMQPIINAQINGANARFVLGSAAFYSIITRAAAVQFSLPLGPAPAGFYLVGIKGSADAKVTRIKEYTFAGFRIPNVEFFVVDSDVGHGSAGVLGQNFLRNTDVEYDLGHGVVRLAHAEDCKNTLLANWADAKSVSMMDITVTTFKEPYIIGTAYINGRKIDVMFDTGSGASMISLKAASRAGITPTTPGVVDGGYTPGIGQRRVKTYIGTFASFKIGDNEEIKNARLRIGDFELPNAEMLIGTDFFLSHHVYVANSQRRLYLTYNGGPVFNLAPSGGQGAAGDGESTDSHGDQPAGAQQGIVN